MNRRNALTRLVAAIGGLFAAQKLGATSTKPDVTISALDAHRYGVDVTGWQREPARDVFVAPRRSRKAKLFLDDGYGTWLDNGDGTTTRCEDGTTVPKFW